MFSRKLSAVAVAACFSIAACGGGGGNDGIDDSTNPLGQGNLAPPDTTVQPNTPANPTVSSTFQVDETARFNRPGDIAFDNAGNLYVMDRGNQAIRKIAATGEVSTIPGSYGEASMLAVDPSGNLIVQTGIDVYRVTPDGNRTVVKTYVEQPGSYTPLRIAVDAQGRIYVLIRYRNVFRVQRINLDNTTTDIYYINTYGYVSYLASDAAGNIATAVTPPGVEPGMEDDGAVQASIDFVPISAQTDTASHSPGIQSWPIDYDYVASSFNLSSGGMTFDAAGNLYVAGGDYTWTPADSYAIYDFNSIRIAKVAPDGSASPLFDGFPGGDNTSRQATSNNYTSIGIAVSKTGDVYLSDPLSQAIYRINSSGQATLVAGKPGEVGSSD